MIKISSQLWWKFIVLQSQLSYLYIHYTVVYKPHTPFSIFRQFLPFLSEWEGYKDLDPNFMLSLFSSNFSAIQHNSHELHCIPHYLSKKQNGAEILKIFEASGIKIMPKWLFSRRHQENLESYSTKSFSILQNPRRES